MKALKSNRLHIGVFGKTNVGKSSLINKITGQDVSIVSEIAGTTTDVVEKSMELLPIGPVTFLDTAGLDDKTELGQKRIEKTFNALDRVDIAVIVCEPDKFDDYEKDLIKKFNDLKIPYFVIMNKCDVLTAKQPSSNVAKIYPSEILQEHQTYMDLTSYRLNVLSSKDIYTSISDPKLIFKFKWFFSLQVFQNNDETLNQFGYSTLFNPDISTKMSSINLENPDFSLIRPKYPVYSFSKSKRFKIIN